MHNGKRRALSGPARAFGGEGRRTRTFDLRLKRPLLYRLSYAPETSW